METENKSRILSNILKTPLLRNFLITSLVVSAIFPFYSVFYIIPSFNMQLTKNTEDEAIRTASHLRDLIIKEKTELTKVSFSNEDVSQINRLIKNFQLEKLKIFSKQGEIIFSSTTKDIGETNKYDYFQNVVAKGNVYTKIVQKNTKSLEDRIVTADVVETYVPVLSNGSFIGAFEIYYDITDRKEKQGNLLARIYAVLFAIVLIFLITVIVILFKASKNITERKKAEAEKAILEAQTRQLQKADSLGRMAGAIAHHFNNQLGVVIGNLEMAIDDLPHGAGPANRLTTAMQAAWKAAEMSGLMLTYLGQSFDKLEPLDLSDACRRGLPMLRAAMPGKVVLETDLPSPGPVISANENQIQQVLTNLVINAWEAIGEGQGAIHLSIKTISPAEIPAAYRLPIGWQSQDSAYAGMEVKDAGCGIADKDIEKLFDPFFSSKFTGRGLGLSVVLGIVKAHDGAVTVESEPGRGSTFRVFLPVSAEEVPRQPDKGNCGDTLLQGVPTIPSSTEMEGSGTVLLVEDEEMVREMAAAMLTRLGFSVLEAKDGVEAVELFRQRQDEIRCVLCDLTMPRMNGWETLTALRNLAPDIPVILASGYDKAQVMAGDHPELPQAFVGKPYKFKGLSDAINQALVSEKK